MAKIETHVRTKLSDGACARPVALVNAGLEDVANQVQVLVLFVLAGGRTVCYAIGSSCPVLLGLVDKDLEFVLDRVVFFDAVHGLAACVTATPSSPRQNTWSALANNANPSRGYRGRARRMAADLRG